MGIQILTNDGSIKDLARNIKNLEKFTLLTLSNTWPEIEIFVMTSAARHHVTVWSEMQSTKKSFCLV